MSGSSRKIAVVLLGLLAICAVGYFFVLPMLEARQSEKVAAAIKAMPGGFTADDVKVGFFNKKVTIKGLKGNPDLGPDIKYEVELGQVELEGVNLEAGSKPGVTHLADSLNIQDCNLRSTVSVEGLGQPISTSAFCKEMTARGISGDLSAVLAIDSLPQLPIRPTPEEAQAYFAAAHRMMTAFATFHIDHMEAGDYRISSPAPLNFTASMDKLSYSDFNMMKMGHIEVKGIKGGAFGNEVVNIEKLSLQGMVMPDIFTPQLSIEDPDAYSRAMLEAFTKTPLAVRGLVIEKLSIKPMTPEAVTLDRLQYDMELGPEKIVVTKEVNNFVMPVSVYSAISYQAAAFGRVHNKPLVFNGSVDIVGSQKDGKGDLALKTVRLDEDNLGSVAVKGELPFVGKGEGLEGLLEYGPAFFLKSAELELEDKSGVETFLGMQLQQLSRGSAEPLPISAATLRSGLVDAIKAEAAKEASPDRKRVIEGFARLVEAPGKLKVSVTPSQPVSVDSLAGGGGELNAQVEYSPAK